MTVTILFISACESTSVTVSDGTKNISISGLVIDGYISGAAVYLDENNNGFWDSEEPKVTTSSSGYFSFDDINLASDAFISVVSVNGVDTATNKVFEGKLRNIVDVANVTETISLNVTPLTDLFSTLFLELTTKNSTTLADSQKVIAVAYSISEEDIDKNPMAYAGVFAKTQEIQQTKSLIEVAVKKAKDNNITSVELETLRYDIKKAIVLEINLYGYLDIPKVLTEIENNTNIIIPSNEKNFIVAQYAEVKRSLNSFVEYKSLTQTNLIDFQLALESEQEKAYTILREALETDVPAIVSLVIDVLTQANPEEPEPEPNPEEPEPEPNPEEPEPEPNPEEPEPEPNPGPDPTPDDTMKSISFNGTVVDGYISGATVCLDINSDEICNSDEPSAITNENGYFSFNNVEVQKDIYIPLIISGGIDVATNKPFEGEFKSVIETATISNDIQLMITPLSDLASILFLQSISQEDATIDDSIKAIANGLGITSEEMAADPMQNVNLFSKTQEIQHIKSLVELVSSESQDENILKNIRINIKEVLINQIVENQILDIDKIMIAIEIELNIAISESKKAFVKSQITEIRRVLDESSIDIWALDRLQFSINSILEDTNSSFEYKDINITDESITQSIFSKADAIFDNSACNLKDTNNTIKDANGTSVRVEDFENGLSLSSSYTSGLTQDENEVTIYYPNLEQTKSGDNTVVFKDNYYFSYDNAWIENSNNTIYIKTPKEADSPYGCYRVKLDSMSENDITFVKVYSYSDIIID